MPRNETNLVAVVGAASSIFCSASVDPLTSYDTAPGAVRIAYSYYFRRMGRKRHKVLVKIRLFSLKFS